MGEPNEGTGGSPLVPEVVVSDAPSALAVAIAKAQEERSALAQPEPEVTLQQLADMGFITPIADPALLRAAFAHRQKLIAQILDPEHDFLYTCVVSDGGKEREIRTTSYAEIQKYHKQYGVPFKARPKKSGVDKLATALGITGRVIEHRGLPIDPEANFTWIKYEVIHTRSGRAAIGQGACYADERPGRWIPKHHVIAIADTRSYGRAVLRIAGFGEVGAEEIDIPDDDGFIPPRIVQSVPQAGQLPAGSGVVLDMSMPQAEAAAKQAVANGRGAHAQNPGTAQGTAQNPGTAQNQAAPRAQQQSAPRGNNDDLPDTITEGQAKKLSELLLKKLGIKEKAQAWLREHAKVERSLHVKEADYQRLMGTLEKMEVP